MTNKSLNKNIISFDFDGVLHTGLSEDIDKDIYIKIFYNKEYAIENQHKYLNPNFKIIEKIKKYLNNKRTIYIVTHRQKDSLIVIKKFLKENLINLLENFSDNGSIKFFAKTKNIIS